MKKTLNKGFTLIELLVVIAIIGILAAIVLSALGDARSKAKYVSAKASISQVRAQAEIFYLDNDSYGTGTNSYSTSGLATTGSTGASATLCTHSGTTRLIEAAGEEGATVRCSSEADAYAVEMSLGGQFFCVDSAGNASEGPTSFDASDESC